MNAAESLKRRARWRWPEIVFWLVAFGALFVPSGKHLILNEVAIFALFSGLCALARNPPELAVLRFITGIGIGGFVPIDTAMVAIGNWLRPAPRTDHW